MQVKKQQLEPDMEQQTGSQFGKEYIKAVYCHLAYLTYMKSTTCEMPGWMNLEQAGITAARKNIKSLDKQMTPYLWQKAKKTKEPLDESERRE